MICAPPARGREEQQLLVMSSTSALCEAVSANDCAISGRHVALHKRRPPQGAPVVQPFLLTKPVPLWPESAPQAPQAADAISLIDGDRGSSSAVVLVPTSWTDALLLQGGGNRNLPSFSTPSPSSLVLSRALEKTTPLKEQQSTALISILLNVAMSQLSESRLLTATAKGYHRLITSANSSNPGEMRGCSRRMRSTVSAVSTPERHSPSTATTTTAATSFGSAVSANTSSANASHEELCIRAVAMLRSCDYPLDDIICLFGVAAVHIESVFVKLQVHDELEKIYIGLLQVFLAHSWLFDEACPIKEWHTHIFRAYCSFSCLNDALMKLFQVQNFKLLVPPGLVKDRLVQLLPFDVLDRILAQTLQAASSCDLLSNFDLSGTASVSAAPVPPAPSCAAAVSSASPSSTSSATSTSSFSSTFAGPTHYRLLNNVRTAAKVRMTSEAITEGVPKRRRSCYLQAKKKCPSASTLKLAAPPQRPLATISPPLMATSITMRQQPFFANDYHRYYYCNQQPHQQRVSHQVHYKKQSSNSSSSSCMSLLKGNSLSGAGVHQQPSDLSSQHLMIKLPLSSSSPSTHLAEEKPTTSAAHLRLNESNGRLLYPRQQPPTLMSTSSRYW